VKPAPFEYHRPKSVSEALDCFARLDGDVRLIAGGQSLVPMLNLRLARPDHLVDLNDLSELDHVSEEGDHIAVGAMVRHHRLATDAQIGAAVPVLAAGAASIGHYAIRQRGTLGGSLAHADPAAQLPLLAVLLDAEINCVSRSGRRAVPAAEFFESLMTTALAADEMIASARFPKLRPGTGWGFELFSQRQGDFAIIATGALIDLAVDGTVSRLRLAIAGIGATPLSLDPITQPFVGGEPDDAWMATLADAVSDGCEIEETRIPAVFRKELTHELTRRAVAAALARARGARKP
jgi:carbon-monoxide dehydrogenase medium subunit